jgi:hypothetical protein
MILGSPPYPEWSRFHRGAPCAFLPHSCRNRWFGVLRALGADRSKCTKALGDKGLTHIESYQVTSLRMACQSAVSRRASGGLGVVVGRVDADMPEPASVHCGINAGREQMYRGRVQAVRRDVL